MENYELSYENIKQIDRVTSQLKELKNELKNNNWISENQHEQQTNSHIINELFYQINNKKAILKTNIVKDYLKEIKDKERNELTSKYSWAWIMAIQIALMSPEIWWENHDKYWKIIIDWILGSDTIEAVKKFQKTYNLKVDGIPGKETLNKLYDILVKKNTIQKTSKWDNKVEQEGWEQKQEGWEQEQEGWEQEQEGWDQEQEGWKQKQEGWEQGQEGWKQKQEGWEQKQESWEQQQEQVEMYWYRSLTNEEFKKCFEKWEDFQQTNVGDCWLLAAIDSLVSFWDYKKLIMTSVFINNNKGFMIRLPLWAWVNESKPFYVSFSELMKEQKGIEWTEYKPITLWSWELKAFRGLKALILAYWKKITWKETFDVSNLDGWYTERAFNDLIYWMNTYICTRSLSYEETSEENDPSWMKDKNFVNAFKTVLEKFNTKNDMLTIGVNQLWNNSEENYSKLGHYSWSNHVVSVEAVKKQWWNLIITLSNPWDSSKSYDISFNELLKSCSKFVLCTKKERKWLQKSHDSYDKKRQEIWSSSVESQKDIKSLNQVIQLTWEKDKTLRKSRWDVIVTNKDIIGFTEDLTISSFWLETEVKEEKWKIIITSWENTLSINRENLSHSYEYEWDNNHNNNYPLYLYWSKIANFINRMKHDYINPKKWANNNPFSLDSKWCLCFNEWWTSSMWGFLRSLYKWSKTLTILEDNWESSLWIISNNVKNDLVEFLNTLYTS